LWNNLAHIEQYWSYAAHSLICEWTSSENKSAYLSKYAYDACRQCVFHIDESVQLVHCLFGRRSEVGFYIFEGMMSFKGGEW
jgi:hypothetical protein